MNTTSVSIENAVRGSNPMDGILVHNLISFGYAPFVIKDVCSKLDYKGNFIHNLKQTLKLKNLIVELSRSTVELSKTATAANVLGCIRIANNQNATPSMEAIKLVHQTLPGGTWFKVTELTALHPEKTIPYLKKLIGYLFNLGALKRTGRNAHHYTFYKNNDFFSDFEKEAPVTASGETINPTEKRILDILIRFRNMEDGTRQTIGTYLKEKKCPYYAQISQILKENSFVSNLENNPANVGWNRKVLDTPNIVFVRELISKAKQKVVKAKPKQSKLSTEPYRNVSNKDTQVVVKAPKVSNDAVFSLLKDIIGLDLAVDKRVGSFLKDNNLKKKFTKHLVKELMKDLE